MIYIAHRGNVSGQNLEFENSVLYIEQALNMGFDVEVDLHYVNGVLYLGHDDPQYPVDLSWLLANTSRLWIHCKNSGAMEFCQRTDLHYFWHQNDDYTLTSNGIIWAYPGKEPPSKKTITVLPELVWKISDYRRHVTMGVCSDFVADMRNLENESEEI